MLEQISQSKFFEKINQNNSISSDSKKSGEFFFALLDPFHKRGLEMVKDLYVGD